MTVIGFVVLCCAFFLAYYVRRGNKEKRDTPADNGRWRFEIGEHGAGSVLCGLLALAEKIYLVLSSLCSLRVVRANQRSVGG